MNSYFANKKKWLLISSSILYIYFSFTLKFKKEELKAKAGIVEAQSNTITLEQHKIDELVNADLAILKDLNIDLGLKKQDIHSDIYLYELLSYDALVELNKIDSNVSLDYAELSDLNTLYIDIYKKDITLSLSDFPGLDMVMDIDIEHYVDINASLNQAILQDLNYINLNLEKKLNIEATLSAPEINYIYPDSVIIGDIDSHLALGEAMLRPTSFDLLLDKLNLNLAFGEADYTNISLNLVIPRENIDLDIYLLEPSSMLLDILVGRIDIEGTLSELDPEGFYVNITQNKIKQYVDTDLLVARYVKVPLRIRDHIDIKASISEPDMEETEIVLITPTVDAEASAYLMSELNYDITLFTKKIETEASAGYADLDDAEVYVNIDRIPEVYASGSFADTTSIDTEPITLAKYLTKVRLDLENTPGMYIPIILDHYIDLHVSADSADLYDLNYISILKNKDLNISTVLDYSDFGPLDPLDLELDIIRPRVYLDTSTLIENSLDLELDKFYLTAAISEADYDPMNINLVIPNNVDVDLTPYFLSTQSFKLDILTKKIDLKPLIEVIEKGGIVIDVLLDKWIIANIGAYLNVVTPTTATINIYKTEITTAISEPDFEEAKINIILPLISTNLDSYLITTLEYSPAVMLKQIETTAALGNPDFEEMTSQLEINRIYTYIASSELVSTQVTSITLGNQYSNIGISLAFDVDGGMGFDIIVPNNIYEYANANLVSVISYTPENVTLKKIDIYNGMAESWYTYIDIPDYIKIYDKEIYTVVDSSAPVDFDISDILLPPKSMTTDFSNILAEPFNLEAKLIDKIGIYAFAELEVWQTIPFSFTLSVPKHDYVDTTSLDYLSLETIYLTDIVSDGKNITIDPNISSANAQLTEVSVIVNNNISILNKVGASRIRIFEDLDGLEFEDLDGLSFSDLYTIDIS